MVQPLSLEEFLNSAQSPSVTPVQPAPQAAARGLAPSTMSLQEFAGNSAPASTTENIPGGGVTEVPKGGTPKTVQLGNNPVQEGDVAARFSQEATNPNPPSQITKPTVSEVVNAFTNGLNPFQDELTGFMGAIMGKGYNKTLKEYRKKSEEFSKAYPTESTLAEISGGIAQTLSAMGVLKPVSSTRQAILQATKFGFVLGAINGFGQGEGGFKNRLVTAGTEATIQGVASGILTGLPAGATRVGKAAASYVRTAVNPQSEAVSRLGGALATDVKAGDTAMSEQLYNAAQQAEEPVMNIDRGGRATRQLVQGAANESPEAMVTAGEAITTRAKQTGTRIQAVAHDLIYGPGQPGASAFATRQATQDAARAANRPAYKAAYEAGDHAVWSPELERLTNAPSVIEGVKKAISNWKDWAIKDGFGGMNPPVEVTADGRLKFVGGKGMPVYPNIQFWDYVQRGMREVAETYPAGSEAAKRVGDVRKLLNKELDAIVPEFGNARAGAARYFGADSAAEAGEKFAFSTGKQVDINSAAANHAKLSDPDKKIFAEHFVSGLLRKMEDSADPVRMVEDIFGNTNKPGREFWRKKIMLALGDKAPQLEAYMRFQTAMNAARSAVGGYSTTARQTASRYTQDSAKLLLSSIIGGAAFETLYSGYTHGGVSVTPIFIGMMLGLSHQMRMNMSPRVAEEIAKLATSQDPVAWERASKIIAKSPRLFTLFRNFGTLAGKTLAVKTSKPVAGALGAQ